MHHSKSLALCLALVSFASLAWAAPTNTCGATTSSSATVSVVKKFVTPATQPTSSDPHAQFKAGVITNVTCDSSTVISLQDQDIAELAICGGIAAPILNCEGNPSTTTGTSGKAKWTLTAPQGATINVFKGSWEECCNAARATCPGTFTATCLGGVTSGAGFEFSLTAV